MPAPENTPAGPAPMPTCRNCDQTTSFTVSLTIVSTITDSTVVGPPRLHLDLQCDRCDSTDVEGDPVESLRPLLIETEP